MARSLRLGRLRANLDRLGFAF